MLCLSIIAQKEHHAQG